MYHDSSTTTRPDSANSGHRVKKTSHVPPPRLSDTFPSTAPPPQRSDKVPELHSDAYQGAVGSYVRAVAPNTEADPVAVLVQCLQWAGCRIGRGTYLLRGNEKIPPLVWSLIVGPTAAGRKGTSAAESLDVLSRLAPGAPRRLNGLSSGEGLIQAFLPDADGEPLPDERLLITESEWEVVLARMRRPDNSLSAVLRDMFDGRPLSTITVKARTVEDYSAVVVGHCTPAAMRMATSDLDVSNGFLNRFLIVESHRPKLIAWPQSHGSVTTSLLNQIIKAASATAITGEWTLSDEARDGYAKWYLQSEKEREELPERVADALARMSTHVLRVALVYAALDPTATDSKTIRVEHFAAAQAVCEYASKSSWRIFGPGKAGNDGLILAALRKSPAGLSRTELIRQVFKNHIAANDLDTALVALLNAGLIVEAMQATAGRDKALYMLA